jgi:signal recognition particle subunit SRP19
MELRVKDKIVLWPAYFDTDHSWRQGRRISKKLALRGVKSEEISKAAKDLGLKPVLKPGMAFPKQPWRRTGCVLVNKRDSKSEVLKDMARRIRANRASN